MPKFGSVLLLAAIGIGSAVQLPAAAQRGPVPAGAPNALFWDDAIAAFAVGEQKSPKVFTLQDAARCGGRWRVHVEEIDNWGFPDAALGAFVDALGYREAEESIVFFLFEEPDQEAIDAAAREARRLLKQALRGDAEAARAYFENLGLCSSKAEEARDDWPQSAMEAAEVTAARIREAEEPLPAGDFDEPVNQPKLALAQLFARRLRDGKPIADLLASEISFEYSITHPCGAQTTATLDPLPAANVDAGFTFIAEYQWENPDCEVPSATKWLEHFSLQSIVSRWDSAIDLTVEDHNFELFYLMSEGPPEYLIVEIATDGDRLAISHIVYRWNFQRN